jgi:hypothetical protein
MKWNAANVEKCRKHRKTWREKNPKKIKAENVVNKAIIKRDIERKPCEICGTFPAEAHHDNYDEPFLVKWLCSDCHRRHHLISMGYKINVPMNAQQ